jgi:hypothetical protein
MLRGTAHTISDGDRFGKSFDVVVSDCDAEEVVDLVSPREEKRI